MKYWRLLFLLLTAKFFPAVLTGCKPNLEPHSFSIPVAGQFYKVELKKINFNEYIISSSPNSEKARQSISEWKLDYPVFNFESADIDGDGTKDILVGVVKKTKFDSAYRKRLFIFKLVDGYIRPLWLGSRMSQPLEDFKVVSLNNASIVRTIEIEQNGNYLVAEYKWKGFGLSFLRYVTRNVGISVAQQKLTDITQY